MKLVNVGQLTRWIVCDDVDTPTDRFLCKADLSYYFIPRVLTLIRYTFSLKM